MHAPDLGRAVGRLSPLALALLLVTLILGTTGGAVAGALITGAQIKDGTVSGADIKNNSLSGADIKDESRIFAATAGVTPGTELNDFTSPNWVAIVSKTFTVRAGYLFITADLYAQPDNSLGSDGYLEYAIKVDGKIVQGRHVLDTLLSDHNELAGSVTAVVPVSAGSHTIKLIAREGASGSYIFERSINAVWTAGGSRSGAYLEPAVRPAHRNVQR
ncbi:MAG: hypothetical protein NTX33_00140 [Propionibacteriales bacterium]|nr:hypothetical protein [Propionibacteriales bacterium]